MGPHAWKKRVRRISEMSILVPAEIFATTKMSRQAQPLEVLCLASELLASLSLGACYAVHAIGLLLLLSLSSKLILRQDKSSMLLLILKAAIRKELILKVTHHKEATRRKEAIHHKEVIHRKAVTHHKAAIHHKLATLLERTYTTLKQPILQVRQKVYLGLLQNTKLHFQPWEPDVFISLCVMSFM